MDTFTLTHLREILRADPDVDDSSELTPLNAGAPFADLGYDSLALLELAAQLRRLYGVRIADGAIEQMSTPDATVAFVNRLIGHVGTRAVEV